MTSVHRWDDNRIYNKMCRSLAMEGHDVHLVGVMDNNQDGKIIEGVTLHSVSKPVNRCVRFLKTTPKVLAKARFINGDLYHFHDPEFLPYISNFRRIERKPIIYDVHEDYPAAILNKRWLPKLCRPIVSKLFNIFELRSVLALDGLIAAWPKIMERFGIHPRRILINNYPYRNELLNNQGTVQKRNLGCFVYVGALSPNRGILEMIRAVGIGGNGYKLVLGGNWSSKKYKHECQSNQSWSLCEYKGYLRREDMRDLYAIAQAGIIAFFPEPNHLYSMPNKIFEYMSAGIPVIASDLPMQRSIVEEIGCGLVADARSPEAIHDKMRWICEHPHKAAAMGNAGRQAIEYKFNWECEVKKLITFYEEVLSSEMH